ncbi:MAG: arginine--tRNA ligase [Alphaproteobacteria bacterium]|nr:MAG: arginine--tRNA ligase [Alphaproteobacteria bacterium]
MPSLSQQLTDIMTRAFNSLDLPIEYARVNVSGQIETAQFQCNGAMPCAKVAKKNPRDIAQDIIDVVNQDSVASDVFETLSIGGPGFINITLKDTYIAENFKNLATDTRFGISSVRQGQNVVLDYGGPNIAKSMHVGHLRSSIIGDTLRRMCLYAGYDAIGDVHMGDWGTPMGMILSELDIMGFDDDITMEMLADIYPKASTACKEYEQRMALAREATRKLQNGDEAYTRTWREFIDVSVTGMKKNFDALGVHFDEWKGESDAHPYIEGMIADLKAQNLAVESDGALILHVAREDDKKEIPPLILRKSDGAVLYGTTDMATIIERIKTHNPVKIIYVVDQRQSLHFEQVFRAVRVSGIAPEDEMELIHAGFGTMNGTDGKPFKTRAGGVMRLEDLISMAVEKAQNHLNEADLANDMDEVERTGVAHKVALAAVKFADLQNNRTADYVFDIDRMTSFEGKTGPYLLYQAVRIQSLLKKAGVEGDLVVDTCNILDADRSLALLLGELPEYFDNAMKHYTPHILCDYAFKLAQEFSSFYGNCHILSEKDEAVKSSRLALCQQTHKTLVLVLGLLGIEVPNRM